MPILLFASNYRVIARRLRQTICRDVSHATIAVHGFFGSVFKGSFLAMIETIKNSAITSTTTWLVTQLQPNDKLVSTKMQTRELPDYAPD